MLPGENEVLEESIYEAAVVPERWPSLLGDISHAVGAKGGVFFGVSTVATSGVASESLQGAMEAFVSGGWAQRNTRMEAGLKRGLHLTPRFVTEDDYYPGEVEREAIYHEFFFPHGLGHSAGTIAILPHEDMLCISFEQGHEQGPFAARNLERLNALRPHLMRASLVTTRLGMAQIHSAIAILTAIGLPAAAVAQSGAVIEANASFAQATAIWTTRGHNRVALLDRAADAMLHDSLKMLAITPGKRSIPIRTAPGGHIGAVIQVVPLRGLALDIFGNTAAILILSAPRNETIDVSLLLSLFDLTPAEIDIAQCIAAGITVYEIARQRKRSVATVRNQLRGVLEKTGCSRQAELILLLKAFAANS